MLTKTRFDSISEKLSQAYDLPLVFVDNMGNWIFGGMGCDACRSICYREDTPVIPLCRQKMVKIIQESYRWGEGYISTCALGLIVISVPVMENNKIIGGLVSGFAVLPEMKPDIHEEIFNVLNKVKDPIELDALTTVSIRIISHSRLTKGSSLLFDLVQKEHLMDDLSTQKNRDKQKQQFAIANYLSDLKEEKTEISRQILDKEDDILTRIRSGDYNGAREILNEFLGAIFFQSGMNFDVMKVRIFELIVMISRAAVEEGIKAKELLGLNYSYLSKLNEVNTVEDLSYQVKEILENFIEKVSSIKGKKKTIEIKKITDYIHGNYTRPIVIGKIAKHAGLSESRTQHLFKEEIGMPVTTYVRNLRIEYARHLLLNSGLALAEVAAETGFFDQSHFTRTFKVVEGITPLMYRKQGMINN